MHPVSIFWGWKTKNEKNMKMENKPNKQTKYSKILDLPSFQGDLLI